MTLWKQMGLRQEILIGLGNAYCNDGQFLKAELEYLRALRLGETYRLYINLCMLADQFGGHPRLQEYVEGCFRFECFSLCGRYFGIKFKIKLP
jgi:hypothetical protein